jgi:hypothetical protein
MSWYIQVSNYSKCTVEAPLKVEKTPLFKCIVEAPL